MPPTRVFLDWRRPALIAAVDYLRERYAAGLNSSFETPPKQRAKRATSQSQRLLFASDASEAASSPQGLAWDLSNVVVVVPGKRAGRRLLELLVLEANERHLPFTPPQIITEGRLPELLYTPKRPFADDLTQDLAWSHALRSLPGHHRREIVPHEPPADDQTAWLQLGRILRVRHTELAADGLRFDDVVREGTKLPRFPDALRWNAMRLAQQTYLLTLDELKLWDIQTARLVAVEHKEITTDHDIVLLGTVDLNRTMRRILDQVAQRVIALVAAPQSLADRFDAYGCVRPEAWQQVEIPLSDEQLRRVDGPADQADVVADILASYQGKYRGDQITIGVPDERLVPHLQRQLEQCEVPNRWVAGRDLTQTGPYCLLLSAAEFIRTESARAFAALIRHPDIFLQLTAAPECERVAFNVLDEINRLQTDYLVTRINPAAWPKQARTKTDKSERFPSLIRAIASVEELVAPLKARQQKLSRWSEPILAVLKSVYGQQCDDDHTLAALKIIGDRLRLQSQLPESLDPMLTADEAIAWTLSQLKAEVVPPPANANAVELLGWLELPLDDAPALIVTSLNEGFIPSASGADPFLPESLRRSMGLLDNARRYARDAYAVSTILHSRQSVHWIAAHRDAEGNPLIPSRLLFATNEEQVVARAQLFFKPLPEQPLRAPLLGARVPPPLVSRMYVPRPAKVELPTKLSVSQFKVYLSCPYRFYLSNLLRLQAASDRCEELEANAFGNVLHKVLERFGADASVRDSVSEDDIGDFLIEELNKWIGLQYGDRDRLPAVDIQVEQLRDRLRRFARWQAERRQAGWHIAHSETTYGDEAVRDSTAEASPCQRDEVQIEVDCLPFTLRGRIDRIDEHDDTGEICIFDYKTGDKGDKPNDVHRTKQGDWLDLQLPLYRYLARELGFEAQMRLGYILIPKSLDDIGDAIAPWTSAELESADETMRRVVRDIRAGKFWPPADPPQWADDFTAICQDRRRGGRNFEEIVEVAS